MLDTKIIQTLKQKQKYSLSQIQSLKLLSMNYQDLEKHILDIAENNPLLEIDETYKSNINYEINENTKASEPSLFDELNNQLTYITQNKICFELILNLDSNGYLNKSILELSKSLNHTSKEIEDALLIIQDLEPYGVGARDLKECLKIQCIHSDYEIAKSAILILDHLQDLTKNKYNKVANELNINPSLVLQAFEFIKTLNPKPGANYSNTSQTIIPDVFITKSDDNLNIVINDITEHLIINTQYDKSEDIEVKNFINQFKKINDELINQCTKRNKTLSLIINCIVTIQIDYFTKDYQLKPMKLKDIAAITNLNVSTVSRCINSKSLQFENKIILINKLFSKELKSGQSSNYVKSLIHNIIKTEDKNKPYSDNEISNILKEDNIIVSRRTISKYREEMKIKNSPLRKTI